MGKELIHMLQGVHPQRELRKKEALMKKVNRWKMVGNGVDNWIVNMDGGWQRLWCNLANYYEDFKLELPRASEPLSNQRPKLFGEEKEPTLVFLMEAKLCQKKKNGIDQL
jgi:hypothetical protein